MDGEERRLALQRGAALERGATLERGAVLERRAAVGSETLRIYNEFAKPVKFNMFFNDFGAPNPRESKTLRIYTEFAKPMKFCMFFNVFGIHLPIFIIKIPKNGSQIRVCRQRAAKTAAFQYFL